jgi:ubiquinone/menaquinone biosynthesis C-methylase UbiE
VLTIEPERLSLRPGSRVLDLGCGEGRHTRALRFLTGVTSVALDIGESEVAAAAESLRRMDRGEPPSFRSAPDAGSWLALRGDAYRLPFESASFDCVIASEILEHLHDDDGALAEIGRVLKPGGFLAVSVPRWLPELVCWKLSTRYHDTPGGHVRIYRQSDLERKLARYGYRTFFRHFAHALHSPYWWLKCAVGVDRDEALPVRLYHRLLVWDLFAKPRLTRALEKALNPFIGKSVVLYTRKGGAEPRETSGALQA